MRFALLAISVCLGLLPSVGLSRGNLAGDPEKSEQPRWGYAFQGVRAYKQFRKERAPVIGATGKRLLVDSNRGVKRVKFGQAGVLLEPVLLVSPHYAELSGFKTFFENRAQMRRDSHLESALEADIEYAESKLDELATADPTKRIPGQPKGMSHEEFGASLTETRESSKSLMPSLISGGGDVADTVFISFAIKPDVDVPDAYAAVIMYHDSFDEKGKVAGRSGVPSLERLGHLDRDVPNPISIEISTKEQLMRNLELRLYLFSGRGEAIATNASGQLREISEQEKSRIEARSVVLPPR